MTFDFFAPLHVRISNLRNILIFKFYLGKYLLSANYVPSTVLSTSSEQNSLEFLPSWRLRSNIGPGAGNKHVNSSGGEETGNRQISKYTI